MLCTTFMLEMVQWLNTGYWAWYRRLKKSWDSWQLHFLWPRFGFGVAWNFHAKLSKEKSNWDVEGLELIGYVDLLDLIDKNRVQCWTKRESGEAKEKAVLLLRFWRSSTSMAALCCAFIVIAAAFYCCQLSIQHLLWSRKSWMIRNVDTSVVWRSVKVTLDRGAKT